MTEWSFVILWVVVALPLNIYLSWLLYKHELTILDVLAAWRDVVWDRLSPLVWVLYVVLLVGVAGTIYSASTALHAALHEAFVATKTEAHHE